jgi:hypothetical protein
MIVEHSYDSNFVVLVHRNAFGPSDTEPEKGYCLADVKYETANSQKCEPPS